MEHFFLPVILIAFFIIAGVVGFSPELRLKIHLWRGNDRNARKILERLLDKTPERIELYPHLGRIYYHANRRDRRAIKVFETILLMKIPFQWRNDILPLVAKYYIQEGRRDSEAIRLIEKAVETELDRLKW